jgi:hypothetical protein
LNDGFPPVFDSVSTSNLDPSFFDIGSVFHSWFWRYYDHLGRLILINAIWFLVVLIPTWFCCHWVETGSHEKTQLFLLLIVFLFDVSFTFFCAYLVFSIFYTGTNCLNDIWPGILKFWVKAVLLFFSWAVFAVLTSYNIGYYLESKRILEITGWIFGGLFLWILFFCLSSILYQWPLLFFQNPPLVKILYKSLLLVFDNYLVLLLVWVYGVGFVFLFTLLPVLWIFFGFVFFFSFQCILLEKHMLKYKIVYQQKDLSLVLAILEKEKKRSWRELLKPWEYK